MNLNARKGLLPGALMVHVDAFNNAFSLAAKESFKFPLLKCAFHRIFQDFNQLKLELVCILLDVALLPIPPKRIKKLKRPYRISSLLFPMLKVIEDPLQTKRNALAFADVVDSPSYCADCEQGLEQTVHVACCALVHQTNVT